MPFGTTVGGTPLVKSYVGTTPTKRIYVGSTHVWPPITATVTYVSSQVFTGSSSMNFPSHIAGDLLVVVAMGGAPPTPPAGLGWITAHTSSSGTPATTVAYKFATSSVTSSGAWGGNTAGTMYVFRNANTASPFGAIGTSVGPSSTTVTAPGITLTDPSGDSVVVHSYFNNGTTGAWVNKTPAGFINKNQQARMASSQMIDTEGATVDSSVMTHSAAATWRSLAFEVLPAAAAEGLYDVQIEYLPGYQVRITALTSYADDEVNDAFFFRGTPTATQDGYKGRTFTLTYTAPTVQTCTLQDYWGGPGGTYQSKQISFTFAPKA